MTTPASWFTTEIQQMMFGFGDSKRPLQETAVLVEEIVHQQMVTLIYQAAEIAAHRGDKPISIEDILFIIRKDKVKLKRLLQYYEVRDMKNVIKSSMATGEDSNVDSCLVTDKRTMGKNRQVCYEFISSIDQTGELLALFYDREPDILKHERMLRSEIQAQGMDAQQYIEFCQARQTNFSRRYSKSQRFRDWLQVSLNSEVILTAAVLDILSYLAYECVAQIVDLSLLVKQDVRVRHGDPLSRLQPPLCVNYAELQISSIYNKADPIADTSQSPPYDNLAGNTSALGAVLTATGISVARGVVKKKRKKGDPTTTLESSWNSTILPSDVREAMRRYYTDIGPFASQLKLSPHCSSWNKTVCN